MKIAKIITEFINEAEKLIGKTGKEKKHFVLELIAKLDDRTFLAGLPNELEEQFLSYLIDYTVFLFKKKNVV